MNTLKDQVILITGANRGIGKSLVEEALKKGARKIYAAARDVRKIPDFGDGRVAALELDITSMQQIGRLKEAAADVQILINNAGSLTSGTILETEAGAIESDMRTNYFGTLAMMREFAPVLEKNAPSKIINIVSIVAYSPLASIAGYSASKAALFSATLSVRTELAEKGVAVHMVNPGAIDTDMNKESDWEMPSPDGIAKIILDKTEAGELDIIPDEMGLGMFSAWKHEPAKLAETFAQIYYKEIGAV